MLPEYLCYKVNQASAAVPTSGSSRQQVRVRMIAKLRALVSLQKQWGSIHELYAGQSKEHVTNIISSRCIRFPDSKFGMAWDFVQVRHLGHLMHTVFKKSRGSTAVPGPAECVIRRASANNYYKLLAWHDNDLYCRCLRLCTWHILFHFAWGSTLTWSYSLRCGAQALRKKSERGVVL